MSEQIDSRVDLNLAERFPGWVTADARAGFQGYLVKPENLIQFAKTLRDDLNYDLLSSVTGVDYPAESLMEVVYHVFQTTGGPIVNFKVQVPRDNPVVPSLVSIWTGAEFQEREAWDLLGIRFEGHPDLRRILLWEGFDGHPLRKDWKEAYYEEELKPFKSRWPDGQVIRSED
jgi:NADH-quinone oxidoreductase subunit D/NADH-quinone oxidoreductase subunit C/D